MPDNIYPDLSNSQFDIQYARRLGLSSDLQASLVTGETGTSPVIKTPDDNSTGFLRFAVAAEDALATQNRSFDLAAGFSFALTQLGNNHFLVDPPNGLYQLGAIPVPGSDSGLSYTYLEVNDTDGTILLQAPQGIIATGYGYGNHSGTAAFNLAVDAGGNLIEVAAGGGGSGTVNSGLFRKAAYYITNPSGTVVDDWAGVEFGNTNLNTKIITQATTEVGLEIKLITSQTDNAFNVSSAALTGDLFSVSAIGRTLIGTSTNTNVFGDVCILKVVEGSELSFAHVSGSPRVTMSNGTVIGYLGSLSNPIGVYYGSYSAHNVRFRSNNVDYIQLATNGDFLSRGRALFATNSSFVYTPTHQLETLSEDNNNTVMYPLGLTRRSGGTITAGIGIGFDFEIQTDVANFEIGAKIEAVTTDVTGGSEDFDLVFKTMLAGAGATESLRILSDGKLKIQSLAQDDTETKVVVWNSTDKVLEWRDASTFGGGSDTNFAEDDLTATGNRVHTFDANTAEITFNTLAGASGFKLSSTSTAATGANTQRLVEIVKSGTQVNAVDSSALYIDNSTVPGFGSYAFGLYATSSIPSGSGNACAIRANVTTQLGMWAVATTGTAILAQSAAAGAGYVIGAFNSSTGAAVQGQSTSGIGVKGITLGSVYAGEFTGNAGGGISASAVAGFPGYFNLTPSDNPDGSVYPILKLAKTNSGTVNDGSGVSIEFHSSTTTAVQLVGQIIAKWSESTNASRMSQTIITGVDTGSTVDLLTLGGQGYMQLRTITATQASAITAANGMILYVTDTDATFTSVGFWGREAGAWVKL